MTSKNDLNKLHQKLQEWRSKLKASTKNEPYIPEIGTTESMGLYSERDRINALSNTQPLKKVPCPACNMAALTHRPEGGYHCNTCQSDFL